MFKAGIGAQGKREKKSQLIPIWFDLFLSSAGVLERRTINFNLFECDLINFDLFDLFKRVGRNTVQNMVKYVKIR